MEFKSKNSFQSLDKLIVSEVLILGAIEKDGKVVLVHPSQKAENGLDIA